MHEVFSFGTQICFWPWHLLSRHNIPSDKLFLSSFATAVAQSEVCSLGMQAAPSSIPMSGTFFRGNLVMKTFLRPFSLFHWFKKSSCQLLAKECALSTGKLPRRLAQEQCGYVNWLRPKWPKMCWRAVKQKSNQTKSSFASMCMHTRTQRERRFHVCDIFSSFSFVSLKYLFSTLISWPT